MAPKKPKAIAKEEYIKNIKQYSHQSRSKAFFDYVKKVEVMIERVFPKDKGFEKETYERHTNMLITQLGLIFKDANASNLSREEKKLLQK